MVLVKNRNDVINDARQFLCENIYGEIPARPLHLSADVVERDEFFAAGKATLNRMQIICELENHSIIQFPFISVIPQGRDKVPAIVSVEHEGGAPNKFLPIEEIVDRGYAVFCFNCSDVTANNGNFKEKLYQSLATRKKKTAPGKIAIWAYAMIRVAEYVSDLDCIDKSRIIASGHSFLGKSALLAAAFSDKITHVIANDSMGFGCLSQVGDPSVMYPYMFCPRFSSGEWQDNAKNEHYTLLVSCSEKKILVGAAKDDLRSLPSEELEYLNRVKAEMPDFDYHFHSRSGCQYFSRDDWNTYLDFID